MNTYTAALLRCDGDRYRAVPFENPPGEYRVVSLERLAKRGVDTFDAYATM